MVLTEKDRSNSFGTSDGLSSCPADVQPQIALEEARSSNAKVDQAYLSSKTSTKFFRSVLFQVILFSCLSFVGPSIFDGFSNLGGGGLSTPYLANLAITLNYVCGFVVTLFGGPLINKICIKWSSFISALTFPLVGSGYYVSARYGIDSYLLVATSLNGLISGFRESDVFFFVHSCSALCLA